MTVRPKLAQRVNVVVSRHQGVLKQPALAALTAGGSAEPGAIGDGSAGSRALRTPSDKCYLEPSQYVSSPAKVSADQTTGTHSSAWRSVKTPRRHRKMTTFQIDQDHVFNGISNNTPRIMETFQNHLKMTSSHIGPKYNLLTIIRMYGSERNFK